MTDATATPTATWTDTVLAVVNSKPFIALITAVLSGIGVTWWQGDASAKERGVEVNQVVRGAQMAQAATETMARDAVDVIIDACVAELRKGKKK